MIDTLRYWAAVILVAMTPPAIIYWYVAHPLAETWRRLGVRVSLTILIGGLVLSILALVAVRDWIMVGDFGWNPWLAAAGVPLYLASIVLERKLRVHLDLRMLVGIPEFDSREPQGGTLLDQGIYAVVRNPRYVAFLLGVLGVALMVNWGTAYLVWLLSIPAIWGVTLLEERELRQRLGAPYLEYCRRVPRFLPRRGGVPGG